MNEETRDQRCGDFTALTPDVIIDAVEAATGLRLVGYSNPLHSYINRVYELQTADREKLIIKLYRPGRWSCEAILEEHAFVLECAADEIPVVAPLLQKDGSSLGEANGVFFALYPKRHGRQFEPIDEDDWRRLGRVVARAHVAGARSQAAHRLRLHPEVTTVTDVAQLLDGGHVPAKHRNAFADTAEQILEEICPLFEGLECIRIHGDCHAGNILNRPDEGLLLIDFDDMVMGPPIQDLWMPLPEHVINSDQELRLVLEGYRDFREFDPRSVVLIEPLRAMRMLYFLDWISRQRDDPCFERNFPDWGKDAYWREQIDSLLLQLHAIREHIDAASDPQAFSS